MVHSFDLWLFTNVSEPIGPILKTQPVWLTIEGGTNSLYRNLGNQQPIDAA